MFSFKRADVSEISDIQRIAAMTWPATYEPILGKQQVSYMLETLYSHEALKQQFDEGQLFYFIYQSDELAGFASFGNIDTDTCKLHKIYILPQQQGDGAGRALLQFVINKAISSGASQLLLNVNRHNQAKMFYEKNGFVVTGEVDIYIGNGYYMNDFIMMLHLDRQTTG